MIEQSSENENLLFDQGENGDSTSKYKVKVGDFEGPLDLLLYLIRNSEINIYDIQIAEITRQYLEYLSLLIDMDLDNISEFIEMAATLIYIKSRTLLPVDMDFDGDEEEDLKGDLIAKLLEYQKYKIASGVLEERTDEVDILYKKNNEPLLFDTSEDEDVNWKPLSIIDLVGAFAGVLNNKTDKSSDYEIEKMEYSVEDKIFYLKAILDENENFNYFDVVNSSMSKTELICTFLAILELVKQGFIMIRQHKIFGDIQIVHKKEKVVEQIDKESIDYK